MYPKTIDTTILPWVPLNFPGVSIRVIHEDKNSGGSTVMTRLEPGATIPAHVHSKADETVFVISGDFIEEDKEHGPGYFFMAQAGVSHGPHKSRTGFRTFTHPETGRSIIAGMGELHLEVLLERLERDHGVQVNAGQPAIAYRETISAAAEADHLLRKQNGGTGMYARVNVAVRPNEPGRGFSIENLVSGGNIPLQFLKAVRNGVQEGLQEGVLAGYPVVDVHVDILDGAAHEKDSNDVAFRLAAASAVREALHKAKPLLLEPVMRVEVETPNEEQGDLLGDLTRRRGNILAVEPGRNTVVLNAQVPLAELWGYANAIRSLSSGRASYSMSPSHFERIPDALAVKIINAAK
jgi:elongation factor G